MRKIKESVANKRLVLKALNIQGGCTQPQICQHTQLTKSQVKTAVHDLKQAGEIYQDGSLYYPSSSKLDSFVRQRLWNRHLFDGVLR